MGSDIDIFLSNAMKFKYFSNCSNTFWGFCKHFAY